MDELNKIVYLHIYMGNMKKHKTRFKQLEFHPDYFNPTDYLVIVEFEGNVPKASYTVRVPEPITHFPKFPHFKN